MSTPKLFHPARAGDIELKNRIVMAPLTRNRASDGDNLPMDIHVEYYTQRADAGLIVTEATQISPEGKGYAWTPGIYSDAQVEAWKNVTDAVHEAGGKIVMQLWHVGRISHNSLQEDGKQPVAPSAIRAEAPTFDGEKMVDVSEPRALRLDELPRIVEDYRKAAENAKKAGFDGVEVHGANGYLLDQFLKDGSNKRTDDYGGSYQNRMRLLLEVLDVVEGVWGPARTGLRLSPFSAANDATDSDPAALAEALVDALKDRGLAYVHVIEGQTGGSRDAVPDSVDLRSLKDRLGTTWMANNGYDRDLAIDRVESGDADLVAFGVPYIANPDLAKRLERNAALNTPDKDTFYGGGREGYVDYPFLEQVATASNTAAE
ncbi:12-oxophytodienoate reductase [Roseivivax halodurans JCM 10272]|uniref:12-oxophytodienoate reductase n=1 Tax=Roseivivax halodurans JCM 10272 TaxID=1449350 RepID=X7EAN5_9RHOB|nr:alkene reductase [Roseivivax halodurans]ETX12992.1 12-oxophytodienoate reductase [Roseivivax halodurans JCM 10272]